MKTMAELIREAKADVLQMCSAHAENVFIGFDDADDPRECDALQRAKEQVSDELFRRAERLRPTQP